MYLLIIKIINDDDDEQAWNEHALVYFVALFQFQLEDKERRQNTVKNNKIKNISLSLTLFLPDN